MSRSADVFVAPDDDPRERGPTLGDERTTLVEYLRCQRLTLELKCSGLDAAALASRSVEPSTMSLLGLVRHMADVERTWFRRRMAAQDAPPRFRSDTDPDGDFDGAVPDPAVVAEAWEAWRAEVVFTDQFVAGAPDLDVTGNDPGRGPVSLGEVLVHRWRSTRGTTAAGLAPSDPPDRTPRRCEPAHPRGRPRLPHHPRLAQPRLPTRTGELVHRGFAGRCHLHREHRH